MEVIKHYLYTKEHEWISLEDGVGTVGITEYAQSSLGDITYVELPEVDKEVEQFEDLLSIESVKSASDIFAPMSGVVVEVNEDLPDDPSLLNKYCYDKGWIAKIQVDDMEEASNLMTAQEYEKYLQSQDRGDLSDGDEDEE